MPSYEAALIVVTALERPQLKNVIKTACEKIFSAGGVIKKMENLGHRELPHPIKKQSQWNTHGNYFCLQFDCSAEAMAKISSDYYLMRNILRHGIVRNEEEPRRPCLDGQCLFGELKNPDHDRAVYTKRVLQRFKNRDFSNV